MSVTPVRKEIPAFATVAQEQGAGPSLLSSTVPLVRYPSGALAEPLLWVITPSHCARAPVGWE